ncbi:MAG TPA: ribosomal RNA small subunit methyltransferase A [Candidatus Korarchaeota archaeon]|nr:ribosomal RNA small subunit methyltransferase A [Candidatus Korarchaeota archaeon]
MVSKKWLNVIADLLEIDPSDTVIELGAGTGNLSEEILKRGPRKLVLVEKDPEMISALKHRFSGDHRVEILVEDIRNLFPLRRYDKIVSNPPYYLSSLIVLGLVRSRFKKAVLTFQKEFAERLVARPGTPGYGSLSVIANLSFNIKRVATVGRGSFKPSPKVDSAILIFEPKDLPEKTKECVLKYGKVIFSRRKRTLKNILRPLIGERAEDAPYSLKRPYHLTPEEVLEVAMWLERILSE